jgi:hypothetical protein
MASDDEAARKARADRLRTHIASSKKAAEVPASATDSPSSKPAKTESPREFVERRMRELRAEEEAS